MYLPVDSFCEFMLSFSHVKKELEKSVGVWWNPIVWPAQKKEVLHLSYL